MKLVVTAMILVMVLALGALEILAARGVSDANPPGGAAVHTWTAR